MLRKYVACCVSMFGAAMIIAPASHALTGVGAAIPFYEFEAESGALGGGATVRSMGITLPDLPTPEHDASGRAFVELNDTGESVTFTNTTGVAVNTIVVRASIPDAPAGGGITATLDLYVDGVFRQALTLTSKYTWIYGLADQTNNNPSAGAPRKFYDEARAHISGIPVASGSTVMLKKNSGNAASFYHIDLIDLEASGPAKARPANSLSVTDYGAVANDGLDDTAAFKDCISACQSGKKIMWMPSGTFHTGGIIEATGIEICGAGMWYTTNQRISVPGNTRHKWQLTDCIARDFYVDSPAVSRDRTADGNDYGFTINGTNSWLMERVWVRNCDAGFWCSGVNGIIRNCRAANNWGDGINLNNGPSSSESGRGWNLTCENNFIRGCGDDGIAINSQNGGGTQWNVRDIVIQNNTTVGQYWANGLRIAGGRNSILRYNLIKDPADGIGLTIGIFGTTGNPLESALVQSNVFIRCCGYRDSVSYGALTVISTNASSVSILDNVITDSPRAGIALDDGYQIVVSNNLIESPQEEGIYVKSKSIGFAEISYNTLTGLKAGEDAFRNDSPTTYAVNVHDNSWQNGVLPASATTWIGTSTNRWADPAGWSGGVAPLTQNQNFTVKFEGNGASECVLDRSATLAQLQMGSSGGQSMSFLRLTSGANLVCGLNSDDGTTWTAIGYSRPAMMIIETGAVFSTATYLLLGRDGGDSFLTIDGGTVDVATTISIGNTNHISSGFITVDGGGELFADGFTLKSTNSVIDVRNGAIVLDGDDRSAVNGWVAQNIIVAYGGAGILHFDYGRTHPGKTTLTATLPSGYDIWAATNGIIGSMTDDDDGDGLNNLSEYAVSETPTLIKAGSVFNFIYQQRTDDPDLTYTVETTTQLVSGVWTNTGYTVIGTNVTGGTYNDVTCSIPTDKPQYYIRLKLMYQ